MDRERDGFGQLIWVAHEDRGEVLPERPPPAVHDAHHPQRAAEGVNIFAGEFQLRPTWPILVEKCQNALIVNSWLIQRFHEALVVRYQEISVELWREIEY